MESFLTYFILKMKIAHMEGIKTFQNRDRNFLCYKWTTTAE